MAKTLSTTTSAPTSWASRATAAMSITSSVGFEIVSKKATRVSGRSASFQASRSVPSISVTSTPKRVSTSSRM